MNRLNQLHIVRFWAMILACGLFSQPVRMMAQRHRPGTPFITQYAKTDYQGGTQNWAILQDEQDIIYIGNNHGLLEFDGVAWHRYELPNQTLVRSLAFDGADRLYVGGQGEWGFFSQNHEGELKYHSLTQNIHGNARNYDDVWKIFIHHDHVIGVSHLQLMMWDRMQMKLIVSDENSRFDNAFQVGDRLFVHDWQKGIMELDKDLNLSPLKGGQRLKRETVVSMLPHDQGVLVITAQKGIYLYDESGFIAGKGPVHDFLQKNHAYCGIRLKNGNYAFGSPHNGLIVSEGDSAIVLQINKDKGMSNNTVLCMFQDRKGHLWLGLDNGINYVEVNSPFSMLGPTAGIEGTGYAAIVHNQNLYLGTNQGVFSSPWANNQNLDFAHLPEPVGQVWSFADIGQDLWVGHHDGAYRLDSRGVSRQVSQVAGGWKLLPLKHHAGMAVAGTYDGLVRYRNQNGQWIEDGQIPGFNESCRIMGEDDQGNIWVTHFYRGVFRIKLADDLSKLEEVTSFDQQAGLPSSFSANVYRIYEELVFTTPKGVYRFLSEKNQFELHPVLDSIFGNTVPKWLWEAPSGEVWFSSDQEFGYLKIIEKGLQYQMEKVLLNRLHPSLVEGFEHVYVYDDKNVFIATETGFVHYNSDFPHESDFPLTAHIREIRDLHRDTLIYRESGFGQGMASSELKLSSQVRSLRFDFAAAQFSKNAQTEYRFQLQGFDEGWSAWDGRVSKEYTNLSPGTYRFMVQARNDLRVTSEICQFEFQISAPWYLLPGTKILWAVLMVAFFAGAIYQNYWRVSRRAETVLKANREEMKVKEASFQRELEKNEEEILRLRNDKLKNELAHHQQELASTTMHLLQKSEMLAKLKNELSRLSKQLPDNQQGEVRQLVKTIEQDIKLDENWDSFEHHFDQVHKNFISRLREAHPNLSPKDLKLAAYLRMNLVTKEIAPLLNISVRGVEISRYRLRKKLDLDHETNLVEYMMSF